MSSWLTSGSSGHWGVGTTPLDPSIEAFGASKCVDCGRCTYACPASQIGGDFSPRGIMERMELSGEVPANKDIWLCMTCRQCTQICQFGVSFHEVIREIRPELRRTLPPEQNHGGALEALERLNAIPGIKPRKQRWMTPDLKLDESSGTLLFVGCTPYFDVIFRYLRTDLLEIPRSSVRLLNAAGVSPRLLMDERCCGHDSYWLGDEELSEKVARLNVEAVERLGINELVAFCPECMVTWKQIYPKFVGKLSFEVRSVSEVLADALDEGRLNLKASKQNLTYQDPCRLGRYAGVYDAPRKLISSIGTLKEMPRSREMAACCGNSSFINCSSQTRLWQLERLEEATETGATKLMTACPKCLIHMSCAMAETLQLIERKKMPILDVYSEAASMLISESSSSHSQ
jgi:heterodisulfide reductase subunit D